jgi:hypothetical protein
MGFQRDAPTRTSQRFVQVSRSNLRDCELIGICVWFVAGIYSERPFFFRTITLEIAAKSNRRHSGKAGGSVSLTPAV